jgi:hypothetical protein
MPKGMYTQAACVLLDRPVSLDDLAVVLNEFEILKRIDECVSVRVSPNTINRRPLR